jgi:hypothetical protein
MINGDTQQMMTFSDTEVTGKVANAGRIEGRSTIEAYANKWLGIVIRKD